MHQAGTKKGPERDTETVWGQKRHWKVARSGKSEIWTPEGVESSSLFHIFWTNDVPKVVFLACVLQVWFFIEFV